MTYYYVGLSGEYIWSVCLSIGLLVCLIGLVYLASLVCLVVLVCLSGWSGLLVCLVYLVGLLVCLMVGWSFGLGGKGIGFSNSSGKVDGQQGALQ